MSNPPSAAPHAQLAAVCARLLEAAGGLELSGAWPEQQFHWLTEAGIAGWVIPREFGGSEVSSSSLLEAYLALSRSCLTTAFILTQRNGACERIARSGNQALKAELLPGLCRGERFATVGISHLTTSRQHLQQAAVTAVPVSGDGYVLNGLVPWVTGAIHARDIITGGTLPDGRQILVAVPTATPGVEIRPPQELLALSASHTGEMELRDVELAGGRVLFGPMPEVMKHSSGTNTGSFSTSALAVGVAQAAGQILKAEARQRADLQDAHQAFARETAQITADLLNAARNVEQGIVEPQAPAMLRQRANSLVLRVTQAALAASKGAGFVRGHPAERHVREALFFLVWSCPQPVVAAALRDLSAPSAAEC